MVARRRVWPYREATRTLAAKAGAQFIDLSAVLTLDCLGEDGVHLNDRAYALLADEVRPVLINGT